jgi:translation initiation factor 2 subunit 1
MILLSELSRRRIRSIQKLIRVGRNEVVVVLRVDKEKGSNTHQQTTVHFYKPDPLVHPLHIGYIDLSKRRVSPEDITKCEERFMKARAVSSIIRHVASRLPSYDPDAGGNNSADGSSEVKKGQDKEGGGGGDEVVPAAGQSEEERLEKLYEQVAWVLGRKYGNVYDAFKLSLTQVSTHSRRHPLLTLSPSMCREPDAVFSALPRPVPQAAYDLLTATIARRLTPQPIKLRADIELTCYNPSGIEAIKKALRAGEEASSEAVPIKAKLVAPPLYVLSTNATDKVSVACLGTQPSIP